jgi:hypothetical protein
MIPEHLAVGDVIEFGARHTTTTTDGDLRWYGWLRYATDVALVVAGPYTDPAAAWRDAAAATAQKRWAQLHGLSLEEPSVSAID